MKSKVHRQKNNRNLLKWLVFYTGLGSAAVSFERVFPRIVVVDAFNEEDARVIFKEDYPDCVLRTIRVLKDSNVLYPGIMEWTSLFDSHPDDVHFPELSTREKKQIQQDMHQETSLITVASQVYIRTGCTARAALLTVTEYARDVYIP